MNELDETIQIFDGDLQHAVRQLIELRDIDLQLHSAAQNNRHIG